MEIFNADQKRNKEINDILQEIKYQTDEYENAYAHFPFFKSYKAQDEKDISTQVLLKYLEKKSAIKLNKRTNDEINKTLEEARKEKHTVSEGYLVKPIEPEFSRLCEEYERKCNGTGEKIENSISNSNKYKISIEDREIRINNYLIGKPHGAGSNFEFFEYIRLQEPNTKIDRNKLPSEYGNSSIQAKVEKKSFIKILNGLGFKGEMLKAFFYDRGNNTLTYRGDEITKEDLERSGVRIPLFLKELELAHIKNSPK